ncbi:MAG: pro-sigmaK processing inhibitor BofA family protein [Firmicutes bacterium]|nr:pro-sigmaK processing inhibitor BofA family protein [Bacillota bacterium]
MNGRTAAGLAFWTALLAALVIVLTLWALTAPLALATRRLAGWLGRALALAARLLRRPLANLAGGTAAVAAANLLLAPGLHVGWNLWNLALLAVLGLPGALLLVALARWPF